MTLASEGEGTMGTQPVRILNSHPYRVHARVPLIARRCECGHTTPRPLTQDYGNFLVPKISDQLTGGVV
jgi:hypothetical protein